MKRGKQDQVSASQEKHLVSPGEYGAWLFDLDGVITDTASVHAAAWKRTFDGYLKVVSKREGRPFEPSEIVPGYYRYVDGKPRYAGVGSFLRSPASSSIGEIRTIPRAGRPSAGSGTVRTSCSTR